ncbi:MAG: MarR family transcriptional regulator [Acidimicrobiales bacterium]
MERTATRTDVHWLDDAEKAAWLALIEVGSGLFDALSSDLRGIADLTLEDYEVLHLLSDQETRRLRVGSLANEMLASRTRLSQRLDRLSERGLVARERCPEDRRAINVVLTEAGYDLLVEVAPNHLDSVRRLVFDHLDTDDVAALAVGLGKVAEHLHALRTGDRTADQ